MKKCYYCGKLQQQEGGAFCPSCGKPLEITGLLLNRALEGDQEALTELYQRTQEMVYSTIRSHVPNDETAQDLMQETYIKAFRNLNQLETAAAFPGWIQTIARNMAADWYKKEKRLETIAISQLEYETEEDFSDQQAVREQAEVDISRMPAEALDRQENNRLLDEILSALPEVYRQTLMMRYFDNMSFSDIAREMGTNDSTVKTRLTAAKKLVEKAVYDLEKKGTKIYGLAPLPFLLFLLRFRQGSIGGAAGQAYVVAEQTAVVAEQTTSAASATPVTSAVASSSAPSATANFTAATATKAAGGLFAKGLGVKIAAAVVAAALLGGIGGAVLTGGIISGNTEESTSTQVEEGEASSAPEEDTASIIEALVDEETAVEIVDSPTEEEMVTLFSSFQKFLTESGADISFRSGELTAAQAVNLASMYLYDNLNYEDTQLVAYNQGSRWVVPISLMEECIIDFFGTELDLTGVTNDDLLTANLTVVYRDDSGDFLVLCGDFGAVSWETVVNDISGPDENDLFAVQLTYQYYYGTDIQGEVSYTCTVQKDETSSYGWVILSMELEGNAAEEDTGEGTYYLESFSYYYNGELSYTYTYTYDSNWNRVTSTYESSSGSSTTTTYTYDSDGKVLTETPGSSRHIYTYTYDSDGKLLEKASNFSVYTYTYDSDTDLLTETTWVVFICTYNSNGDLIGRRVTEDNGYIRTYTYNSDGKVATEVYESSSGDILTSTYTYDSEGRRIAVVQADSHGNRTSYETYTYDDHGHLLTIAGQDSSGNTYTYTYTYITPSALQSS